MYVPIILYCVLNICIRIYMYGCSTISIFRQQAAFVRNVQIIIVSLYLYVPDEGSLLPKYRDCTTSINFELYLMCCGVMLLLLIICIKNVECCKALVL